MKRGWGADVPQNAAPLVFMAVVVEEVDADENNLQLFGITADGISVGVRINDFYPYFVLGLPPEMAHDPEAMFRGADCRQPRQIEKVNRKVHSIYKYFTDDFVAFKIYAENMQHFYSLRKVPPTKYMYEERGVSYTDRFWVDSKMVPMGWAQIGAGHWKSIPGSPHTRCTLDCEITTTWRAIEALSGDTGTGLISSDPVLANTVAPVRTVWLDIECVDPRKCFPEPEFAEVVMVAIVCAENDRICEQRVLHTKTIESAPDCPLRQFSTEQNLLIGLAQYVADFDADLIGTYNGNNFDLPFLAKRAEVLGVGDEFMTLMSRMCTKKAKLESTRFESKAHGRRESFTLRMHGRISWDLLQIVRREYGTELSSFTLNSVSEHFLGDRKADVHHTMIAVLWARSDSDRLRLARYCLKDTLLPMQIDQKLILQLRYIEMARVCGVDLTTLLERGQQIKVVSQLLRMGREEGFALPLQRQFRDMDGKLVGVTGYAPEGKFDGATVLEPKVGYYDDPVAVCDFKSLYPSLQIQHNMSYDTLIPENKIDALGLRDKVKQMASGKWFLSRECGDGIIPRIQQLLLGQRAKVKKMMKSAPDAFTRSVFDMRQLALKLSANSVYGFLGVSIAAGGMLPLFECGESTTAEGRKALMAAKEHAEREGYECIYGDTDSIFLRHPKLKTLEQVAQTVPQLADEITKTHFESPMELEFEKAYTAILLFRKKRYAGLECEYVGGENPFKAPKIKAKGMEMVRRDTCPLVGKTLKMCCKLALEERNPTAALQFAKEVVSNLYERKTPLQELLLTRALTRKPEDYANKQPHGELVRRMQERNADDADDDSPSVGDRIMYVMVKQGTGLASEKSEDPLYVLEHNIPYDVDYYVDQQLKKPLLRFFTPIVGQDAANSIFTGEHTRKRIHKASELVKTGAFSNFFAAAAKYKCLVCGAGANTEVCKTCARKRAAGGSHCAAVVEKMTQIKLEAQEARAAFDTVYASCQKCQGSDEEVLCMARDCPQLYDRHAKQRTCNEKEKRLADIEDLLK